MCSEYWDPRKCARAPPDDAASKLLSTAKIGEGRAYEPRKNAITFAVCGACGILHFIPWFFCLDHSLTAHYLVRKDFFNAQPNDLLLLVFLAQAALIGMFTLIIGSFVHRYPEPFFILWYFGWIAWLILYSSRVLHLKHSDYFNLLNTCFFLAAGADLLLPKSANRFFRNYPPPPGKAFGSPIAWLVKYYTNNPSALLLLIPVIILPHLPVYCETVLGVISVGVLGGGLYRRLVATSRTTAFSALFLHAIYLEPQISRLVWPAVVGHEFDYILTVAAPSLVLKPALALFVTLLALGETSERRDQAQRDLDEAERRGTMMLKEMVQNLPAACLLIQNEKIMLLNDAARKLLGVPENEVSLGSVFAFQQDHQSFLERLHADGHTIGHLTRIRTNNSAGIETSKWVRMDAFEAPASVSDTTPLEIVMLILDRHELELAHAAFSFVHDYLSPRVNRLQGSIAAFDKYQLPAEIAQSRQPLKEVCAELVEATGFIREEFREYWRLHPKVTEGALVQRCLDVAWAQAFHTCSVTLNCEPRINVCSGSLPEETKSLVITERQLTRSLQNLLINAIQHTFKRENRVDLTPIEVELSYKEGWVSISISDHGDGFPDEVRRFLNEPTSIGGDQIGLGLFSVKISVAAAGGENDRRQQNPNEWRLRRNSVASFRSSTCCGSAASACLACSYLMEKVKKWQN